MSNEKKILRKLFVRNSPTVKIFVHSRRVRISINEIVERFDDRTEEAENEGPIRW